MEVYDNIQIRTTGDENCCIHAPCRDCPYNNHDGFFCNMEHYEINTPVNKTKGD